MTADREAVNAEIVHYYLAIVHTSANGTRIGKSQKYKRNSNES